jgi:hypothetical protein
MHKKIVQSEITSHVDRDTGEVVTETNTKVVRFPQEPPFVKMYIQDLCAIVGVADADQALLRHLLLHLNYEGFVFLSSRLREKIAKSLRISQKTLRNRMTRLVTANLIKPVCRSEYRVNPEYFARGDWKSICEQRISYSMTISYSEKGREIKTSKVEGDTHLQEELALN